MIYLSYVAFLPTISQKLAEEPVWLPGNFSVPPSPSKVRIVGRKIQGETPRFETLQVLIIFRRKTHGFVGNHHFRNPPNIWQITISLLVGG